MTWKKVSDDLYKSGLYVIEAFRTKRNLYWVARWEGRVPDAFYIGRRKTLAAAQELCERYEMVRRDPSLLGTVKLYLGK